MRGHREYWMPRVEIGVVIAMGPVADPSGAYGVAIIEAPSLAALEAMQASDPAILSTRGFAYENLPDADDRGAAEHAARPDHFRNSLNREGRLAAR